MNKKILYGVLLAALAGFSSCTVNKNLQDQVAGLSGKLESIEKRLEAVEKIIMPPKDKPQEVALDIPVGKSFVLHAKDTKTKEGKAHLVVFSNFQCPYCAKADEAIRELLNDPELKDQIDIVFKHFPFPRHPLARPASKAALAAGEQGDDNYWAMVDVLFKNQDKLSEDNFVKWAKDLKLDIAKFQKDLKDNDKKYDEIINEDYSLGQKINLGGTPWVVLNGWVMKNGYSAAEVKEELKKHKAN